MKTRIQPTLLALLAASIAAATPSTWNYTFNESNDFTRLLRTAGAAQRWEIVPDSNDPRNRVLRVWLRFVDPGERCILIFDHAPVHFRALKARTRLAQDSVDPVRVTAIANTRTAESITSRQQEISPGVQWSTLRFSFRPDTVQNATETVQPEDSDAHTSSRASIAFHRVIFRFEIADDSPLLESEFFIEFDSVEAYPDSIAD